MSTAFPANRFRRFAQTLRFFTEAAMDQWERWRFTTRHGDVFVTIGRSPEPGATRETYDDISGFTEFDPSLRECRRCGEPVATPHYADVFEHMHYSCFHYEFEHGDVDVDEECAVGGCPSRSAQLSSSLAEWSNWDTAAFALGRAIGRYERNEDYLHVKHEIWTSSELGTGLHDALNALVEGGILERRDEPEIEYRWIAH